MEIWIVFVYGSFDSVWSSERKAKAYAQKIERSEGEGSTEIQYHHMNQAYDEEE